MKFYDLKPILKLNATYSMIIGERSNGKTYSVLNYGLKQFFETGEQTAIIRRWQEDFKSKRATQMYAALVSNGLVEKYSKGEWTDIYYYAGKWYPCRYEEDAKRITSEKPIAFAFSLASMEHDKSTSYPEVTTVLFDEFLTRGYYLPDEFVTFMNVLSTIIRQRDNVKIFMCANTVNQYAPYFKEMGLKNVKDMEQGTIDIYRYGDSELTVAVEYCSPVSRSGKPSDKYFAFGNPRLQMITGGKWEIDIYPHLPYKYVRSDILFTYFIIFSDQILQCEVIQKDNNIFTYIHLKTTELQDDNKDLIFTLEHSPKPNVINALNNPFNNITKKIWMQFQKNKVFYQNNEVGEIVNNYLNNC